MENAKFSVAMSVYGRDNAAWFDLALESVIEQTVRPAEIVLIVDGPVSAELDAVIDKYCVRCHETGIRMNLIRFEKNQGLGTALKTAVENASQDLIARMEYVTEELPLPAMDIHPRFRYLDELEEAYTLRKKKLNMTDQELKQRRIAAEGAVMYAAFSSKDSVSNQAAQFGEGGGFDISNSQKIAAYNLLMNSKEE